tara:strand:+ start:89 stop:922 length:834 start_codon:yes stop_codon:yes gene_type:complete
MTDSYDDCWMCEKCQYYSEQPEHLRTDVGLNKAIERNKVLKVNLMIKSIMNGLIDNVCDTNECCIVATTESQGHGKAWEKDIQKRCFGMTDEELCSYKQIDPHDIRSEHNRYEQCKGRNVSIKTTGSDTIDCADIDRFLGSDNLDMVCIQYNQKEGNIKEAYKTIFFSVDELLKILKDDVGGLEDYKNKIKEYVVIVKGSPKGATTKDLSIDKRQYETDYFKIHAMPSQKRVQAQIKITKIKLKLKSYQEFGGGELFDSKYTKQIRSRKRNRHAKSI